ncbi:hypothetical protein [Demequina sp. SO4-18]|uniref:hypothetical protein n=1 Tax=Demequina sp. SO4-18 TaxID=3401026 RepID=UPI003B595A73
MEWFPPDWIPDGWIPVAAGIIPSIGVGLLFWLAMRAVLRADRNERTALAQSGGEKSDAEPRPEGDASDGGRPA